MILPYAAKNYGKPWLSTDIAALLAFVQEGLTAAEIGRKLGRTKTAIREKRSRYRDRIPRPVPVEVVEPIRITISKGSVAEYYHQGWRLSHFDGDLVVMAWLSAADVRWVG